MSMQESEFDFSPIGSAIKEARKGRGLSRETLAEMCEVSPGYIKSIENTGQNPGFQVFFRIMTELHLSVDKYFYPDLEDEMDGELKGVINMLRDCDPGDFYVVESTLNGLIKRPGRT